MKKIVKNRTKQARRPADDEPTGGAVFRYIETSTLLAAAIDDDPKAKMALQGEGHRIASELTFVEASRVVVRRRAINDLTSAQERTAIRRIRMFRNRCDLLALTERVFERVGRPFPVEPVRTNDAIHLATAELIDEQPQLVTIVTRDRHIRENAIALGFMVE